MQHCCRQGERRVDGREAIQRYWRGAMEAGIKNVALETLEVESDGNLAYEVGAVSLHVPGEGNRMKKVEAKYVVVWKRSGDRWRLHRDIWNMQPAPSDR